MPCKQCGKHGIEGFCSTCQTFFKEESDRKRVSGMATYLYFEDKQLIGQRTAHVAGYKAPSGYHTSMAFHTAYFCPVCGEIWARVLFQPSFNYEHPEGPVLWSTETRRCAAHGDGYLLVGLESQLSHIEGRILRREALLLCLNRGIGEMGSA